MFAVSIELWKYRDRGEGLYLADKRNEMGLGVDSALLFH